MKTILAYGDSLTWGHDPETKSRHPHQSRWPTVLQTNLTNVEVISEGLCGRNTCFDDYAGSADRNGARTLPILLASHAPIDLILIMLGTNDLKPAICGVAEGAEKGMQRLIRIVQTFPFDSPECAAPKILILAPPPQNIEGGQHTTTRVDESKKLAHLYEQLTKKWDVEFFDTTKLCSSSTKDGTHLDEGQTIALGKGLASICKKILE